MGTQSPRNALKDLAATAAGQHGIITYEELRRRGFSTHQLSRLVDQGVLERISRGAYRFIGMPADWEHQVAHAVHCCGPLALVSHRAACALWGLARYRPGPIDILTPWSASRRRAVASLPFGVTHHSTRDLSVIDRARLRDLPVTSATRTLIDMGCYVGVSRLGSMMDDGVRRGLTTFAHLHERTAELSKQGRHGTATVHAALRSRPPESKPSGSSLEEKVRDLLIVAGIPQPVRQCPVECDGKTLHVDLGWPDYRFGVECDGFVWHSLPSDLDEDARRNNEFALHGWLVQRVTDTRLDNDPEGIVHDVRRGLDSASRRNTG